MLVDNGWSMFDHWPILIFVVETLAKTAAGLDKDGIDLMFTVDSEACDRPNLRGKFGRMVLKEALQKAWPPNTGNNESQTNVGQIVSKIYDTWKCKGQKATTLLILTDGNWSETDEGSLNETILRFARKEKQIVGNRHFSIQLIRFGEHHKDRLQWLDDSLCKLHGLKDIVDHCSWRATVDKMFRGSVEGRVDQQDLPELGIPYWYKHLVTFFDSFNDGGSTTPSSPNGNRSRNSLSRFSSITPNIEGRQKKHDYTANVLNNEDNIVSQNTKLLVSAQQEQTYLITAREERILDEEQSSFEVNYGYASNISNKEDGASQYATTLQGTQDERTLVGSHDEQRLEEKESSIVENDDYLSIIPNNDDIASQVAMRRTQPEVLAVREFSHLLSTLPELRSLHREAVEKLGIERFEDNYRKLLKYFTLRLMEKAKSRIEQDTVRVLRRRENRVSIAQRVVALTREDQEADSELFESLRDQAIQKDKSDLERWTEGVYNSPESNADKFGQQPGENSGKDDEHSNEDDEHSDEDDESTLIEALDFPNISQATQFMCRGSPFRTLVFELRLLLLRAPIREVLESTPKSWIRITNLNDTSVLNKAKALIEDKTPYQWDWWPLKPRIPDAPKHQWRLQWEVSRSA
jgi:hypothetical protein